MKDRYMRCTRVHANFYWTEAVRSQRAYHKHHIIQVYSNRKHLPIATKHQVEKELANLNNEKTKKTHWKQYLSTAINIKKTSKANAVNTKN